MPSSEGVPTTKAPGASTTSTARSVSAIRGTVVDMDTLEPIEGATVTAKDKSAVSGQDGVVTLEVAARVGDPVFAEKKGYIPAQRVVREVDTQGVGTVRLELLSLSSPNAPPTPPGS